MYICTDDPNSHEKNRILEVFGPKVFWKKKAIKQLCNENQEYNIEKSQFKMFKVSS